MFNLKGSKTKIAMKAWLLIHFLSMRERMTQIKPIPESFNGLKLSQEKSELTLLFSFYKTNFDKENLFQIKIWTINSSSFTKKWRSEIMPFLWLIAIQFSIPEFYKGGFLPFSSFPIQISKKVPFYPFYSFPIRISKKVAFYPLTVCWFWPRCGPGAAHFAHNGQSPLALRWGPPPV